MADSGKHGGRRERLGAGGVALVVVGLVFLLNQLYGHDVLGSIGLSLGPVLGYWPVLLIVVGALLLLRRE